MKIIESIMKNCPCYRSYEKINVRGLMLHSVGCPQPSAKVWVRIFGASSYGRASVHGFIDANTGTFIIHCLITLMAGTLAVLQIIATLGLRCANRLILDIPEMLSR